MISCHFCHTFSKYSNNYLKFNFQFLSTSTLENSQLPLHIRSEHQTAERYKGSANRGGLDLNIFVNKPDSGKMRQSTTLSSQC